MFGRSTYFSGKEDEATGFWSFLKQDTSSSRVSGVSDEGEPQIVRVDGEFRNDMTNSLADLKTFVDMPTQKRNSAVHYSSVFESGRGKLTADTSAPRHSVMVGLASAGTSRSMLNIPTMTGVMTNDETNGPITKRLESLHSIAVPITMDDVATELMPITRGGTARSNRSTFSNQHSIAVPLSDNNTMDSAWTRASEVNLYKPDTGRTMHHFGAGADTILGSQKTDRSTNSMAVPHFEEDSDTDVSSVSSVGEKSNVL